MATFEELQGYFRGVIARSQDWSPIHRAIALTAKADLDQRLQEAPGVRVGGEVFGGGVIWAPLTENYLKYNPRREGGKIGSDTGELRQSFSIGGPGNIFQTSPLEVVFGSGLPKARGFDTGKRRGGVVTNPRPLLFAHDELTDTIENIVTQYILTP